MLDCNVTYMCTCLHLLPVSSAPSAQHTHTDPVDPFPSIPGSEGRIFGVDWQPSKSSRRPLHFGGSRKCTHVCSCGCARCSRCGCLGSCCAARWFDNRSDNRLAQLPSVLSLVELGPNLPRIRPDMSQDAPCWPILGIGPREQWKSLRICSGRHFPGLDRGSLEIGGRCAKHGSTILMHLWRATARRARAARMRCALDQRAFTRRAKGAFAEFVSHSPPAAHLPTCPSAGACVAGARGKRGRRS